MQYITIQSRCISIAVLGVCIELAAVDGRHTLVNEQELTLGEELTKEASLTGKHGLRKILEEEVLVLVQKTSHIVCYLGNREQ